LPATTGPGRNAHVKFAFLIVAIILFLIDGLLYWAPNPPWSGRLTPLGLAFFAASFAVNG
jgi:hypothetical protein